MNPAQSTTERAMAFDHGMTPAQVDEIDDVMIDLVRIIDRIDRIGVHRNYSLAITKIEEAKHWLRDRKHKTA